MLLMANLAKAFSYLIAAQVQAVGLILLAFWGGDWLNKNHPIGFNWYVVTFTVAVVAVAQTFYVVVKAAMSESKSDSPKGSSKP